MTLPNLAPVLSDEQLERNFADIAPPLSPDSAMLEATKCLFCYDAPCTEACPTHIDVPAFIKKIATGNLKGSARVIFDANPMGHSCARACPVEVLCEFAREHGVRILNVAGPRASGEPEVGDFVKEMLDGLLVETGKQE